MAIQLVGMLVLSRLLPPSDFGLMAMTAVVAGLVNLLRDLGMASSIIQREVLEPGLLDTIFTTSVAIGLVLAAIVAAGASVIGDTFGSVGLPPILIAIAPVFPVSSAGAPHQAVIERRSGFRILAIIEIGAALFALACAIAAAVSGMGAFSLVIQQGITSLVSLFFLYRVSGYRPRLRWNVTQLGSIWRYTSGLSAFNLVNYFARNADTMVIGRFLGAAELGVYYMAYRIALLPIQNVSAAISRALFPTLSRQQGDRRTMGATYLRSIRLIALVCAPLMAGLWTLADRFTSVVLGPRWAGVAGLLVWFAPIGLYQSISTTLGVIYQSAGRTRLLFLVGSFVSAVFVLSFFLGLPAGIGGVVRSYAAAHLVILIPLFVVPLRLLDLDLTDIARAIGPPVLCASVMAAALEGINLALGTAMESNDMQILITQVVGGAATYVIAIALVMPDTIHHYLELVPWISKIRSSEPR